MKTVTGKQQSKFNKLMTQVTKFNLPTFAKDFAEHTTKRSDVLMGDDGKFWVTDWTTANKLHEMGYEYADLS